ncbi:MAG: hypothetical protein ACRBFS_21985 [Aureispira sp.]
MNWTKGSSGCPNGNNAVWLVCFLFFAAYLATKMVLTLNYEAVGDKIGTHYSTLNKVKSCITRDKSKC